MHLCSSEEIHQSHLHYWIWDRSPGGVCWVQLLAQGHFRRSWNGRFQDPPTQNNHLSHLQRRGAPRRWLTATFSACVSLCEANIAHLISVQHRHVQGWLTCESRLFVPALLWGVTFTYRDNKTGGRKPARSNVSKHTVQIRRCRIQFNTVNMCGPHRNGSNWSKIREAIKLQCNNTHMHTHAHARKHTHTHHNYHLLLLMKRPVH